MTTKKSVTIVSVTGHQGYAESSMFAIMRSYQELQNHIPQLKCLLISPEKPENLPDYIQHLRCEYFSYFEYNLFMIYQLGTIIDTDFALVVQNDGWVMNGSQWCDSFFDYDYIGAPIPFLVEVENNQYICHHYQQTWKEHYQQIPENCYEPQNGGFSLRSQKLLNAPRHLGLKYEIEAPQAFSNESRGLKWNTGSHHEDTYLTATKRAILEQHGIRFAPTEVACRFSLEHSIVQHFYQIDISQDRKSVV